MALWDCRKTIVLHDNRWRCDHGWDIDLDDGSSNFHIYNNLCLNGGLKFREGFHRTAENNILVNNSFHPHVWYAGSGDVFRHNIVMTGYQPIGMPAVWGKLIDENLLPDAARWSARKRPIAICTPPPAARSSSMRPTAIFACRTTRRR